MTSIVRVRSVVRKPSGRFQITGTLHQGAFGWISLWTENEWLASLCQIALESDQSMRLTWRQEGEWKTLEAVADLTMPTTQGAA